MVTVDVEFNSESNGEIPIIISQFNRELWCVKVAKLAFFDKFSLLHAISPQELRVTFANAISSFAEFVSASNSEILIVISKLSRKL